MTREELENLTYKELLDHTEYCETQIKELKHIKEELEYRLEKVNLKPEIEIQCNKNPYKIGFIKFVKKTIPEFSYVEYENVDKGEI